ncbi:hypothetical protein L1987_72686 [Smallanthus sonchifolius]|uniref:Uncharacterized protein n=1 Tax=Smallanthus sonchifolius TaxID=185202 RepID=A0ACB9AVX4_9ASTR|nr:hypothetical protein L1987_72686 [Smallanthus sonchifolius]
MRPPVIETDDEDYIKLPPTIGPTSGRRNRDMRQRKRDTSEKHSGDQLSIKSNGSKPEGKSENPVQKEHVLKSLFDEESVSLKKVSLTSNGEVNGGPKSNPGVYIMISSLFFTMFFGKLLGILCTLILVCSLYPHRKNDGNDVRISKNMVVNWPDKGSPEEYKKIVIMAGLLERKSHYR